MKDIIEKQCIDHVFAGIIGTAPPVGFGEPFATAFSNMYNGDEDEIKAAAYICSLFLSAILEGYHTAQLHTFVHYVQEHHERFSFNCNMYESIYSSISAEMLQNVSLLKSDNQQTVRACSQEDIFEAFDFYTNR